MGDCSRGGKYPLKKISGYLIGIVLYKQREMRKIIERCIPSDWAICVGVSPARNRWRIRSFCSALTAVRAWDPLLPPRKCRFVPEVIRIPQCIICVILDNDRQPLKDNPHKKRYGWVIRMKGKINYRVLLVYWIRLGQFSRKCNARSP